jgi:cell division protein FtsW (lipid II flippase)
MTTQMNDSLKKFNYALLLTELILFAIGLWNLTSATSVEDKSQNLYRTQLIWFAMGIGLTLVLQWIHYSFFSRVGYAVYF